ncbi:MAG: hypothetical protein HKO53_11465 [Gemmatimonadetes bacterium]|nr:hypothetical protein [Gemmatimonadota bacterium]NNM33678.1 hypothetical protein [Gemmatimonadota bacterium]
MRALVTFAILSAFTGIACSDDPAEPTVEVPTVTFAATSLTTPFLTAGTTAAPTVEWNGDTGTFALAAAVQGVTVDATTGVVSWDPSLAIGVSTVDVVATNSAGSTTVSLMIDSEFQGAFSGGYNNDPTMQTTPNAFDMTFNADGTMSVSDGGSAGEGTWTRSGTTVTSVYSYDGGTNFFTVEGDVTHTATDAELEGFWYVGDTATAGSEAGYLNVAMMVTP